MRYGTGSRSRCSSNGTTSRGVRALLGHGRIDTTRSTRTSGRTSWPMSLNPASQPCSPLRLRLITDGEGYPAIPGRYGRVEWFTGRDLAAYCDHPRVFAKIW